MISSNNSPSADELKEFMSVYPDIANVLTERERKEQHLSDIIHHNIKALQCTVTTGKKNRGLITVMTYKMLEKPELLTPENIRLSLILGWCVELMQASMLIADDIIDGSVTRRGEPCWYRQPSIGLSAINDSMIIQHDVYFLLKKYFRHHPSYVALTELFHDTILKTAIGQVIDSLSCDENGKSKINIFTMERYFSICKYKTAHYSFYLPVALGMYLAKITDAEQHRQIKDVLLEIGIFFQVQDDFLDCFGDVSKTGKIGTDIQDGKCTWLAVVALQRASSEQRKIMDEHYGKSKPKSIELIRQLYLDLDLPKAYAHYEEACYNKLVSDIQQISEALHRNLLFKILNIVYKRDS